MDMHHYAYAMHMSQAQTSLRLVVLLKKLLRADARGEAFAVRFWNMRNEALTRKQSQLKFGLTLNEEKTRVLEFGRFADQHSAQRGLRRP